ncbi:MAG: chromate transporter [Clostridia bacterium]|nr:chromate transporter [Clostridia bacterium]
MKKLFELFVTFLKIGAFTFGGGYAMIPVIKREVADRKKWVTDGDIMDIVAIAESTPGPIAVNAATFIGKRTAGVAGAAAATLGVVLPAFLIILGVSFLFRISSDIKWISYAFFGIRAAVLALILNAFVTMYKHCPKNLFSYVLAGAVFILAAFLGMPIVAVIGGCAVFGLVFYAACGRKSE